MVDRRTQLITVLAEMLILTGCSTPPENDGVEKVNHIISAQAGAEYQLLDEETEETVQSLLHDELTVVEAVKIAFLKNPSLQAKLEELNIAHADLVQAGLLSNPVFAASARFSDGPTSAINTEFSIAQNFLDFIVLPLRKKLAGAQLEQTRLIVAKEVLSLVTEVRRAYLSLQGTYNYLNLQRELLNESEASLELATRQYEAGNISELDLLLFQKACQQGEINIMKTQSQILDLKGQFYRLMGLNCQEVDWKIPQVLSELREIELTLDQLQTMATVGRVEMRIAHKETEIILKAIAMTEKEAFGSIDVGVDTERDTDRTVVTGPTLSIGLPIFDQKQASVERLKAQLRRNQKNTEALEQSIRSEVWTAFNQLNLKSQIARSYRESFVKLQQRRMELSQSYYENMLIGSYALLSAKRDEIEAKLEYANFLSDYWLTYIQLESAVGKILMHPPHSQENALREQSELHIR